MEIGLGWELGSDDANPISTQYLQFEKISTQLDVWLLVVGLNGFVGFLSTPNFNTYLFILFL